MILMGQDNLFLSFKLVLVVLMVGAWFLLVVVLMFLMFIVKNIVIHGACPSGLSCQNLYGNVELGICASGPLCSGDYSCINGQCQKKI